MGDAKPTQFWSHHHNHNGFWTQCVVALSFWYLASTGRSIAGCLTPIFSRFGPMLGKYALAREIIGVQQPKIIWPTVCESRRYLGVALSFRYLASPDHNIADFATPIISRFGRCSPKWTQNGRLWMSQSPQYSGPLRPTYRKGRIASRNLRDGDAAGQIIAGFRTPIIPRAWV